MIKVTKKDGSILTIQAINGKAGVDGKTPSKEEIVSLIKPLIPEPIKGEDGYTPVKGKDYFDGEDGISPDTQEIIDKVLSIIPKSKTGKVFNQQEIIDSIMVLVKVPIQEQTQVIEYIQRQVASKTYSLNELDNVNLTNLTQTNNKYDLGSGKVQSIVAGSNITVDSTDPSNPIVSSTASSSSTNPSWFKSMGGGSASSTYFMTYNREVVYGGHAYSIYLAGTNIFGGIASSIYTEIAMNGGGA